MGRGRRHGGDYRDGVTRAFYNHDNRDGDSVPRRTGYRGVQRGKFKNQRDRSHTINLPDNLRRDDIDMDKNFIVSPDLVFRERGRGGRGGRRMGRSLTQPHGGPIMPPGAPWYRIDVSGGKNMGKMAVLHAIASSIEVPFTPYHYTDSDRMDASYFYVEGSETISAMKRNSQKMRMSDGRKLVWKVMMAPPPVVPVDAALKDAIAKEMSDHYKTDTKALDMSSFDQREVFKSAGLHVSLGRFNVVEAVIAIIKEHIPETEALDLSRNKFINLRSVASIMRALPNLKILYFKANGLKHVGILDKLQGWRLAELNLEGNPAHRREGAPDYDEYVRKLRGFFPDLQILDGVELPKRKGFDIDLVAKLPKPLPGCVPSAEAQELAMLFLKEYLTCFDADDRSPLIDAYHEFAVFSMSTMSPKVKSPLLFKSRLLKLSGDQYDPYARISTGRDAVMKTLMEMPKVKHDLSSVVIDVPLILPNLLMLEVCGFLRDSNDTLLRFSRTFTLVPKEKGVVVTNDMFFLAIPPPHFAKYAFQGPQEIKRPLIAGQPLVGTPAVPIASASVPAPAVPGVAPFVSVPVEAALTPEAKAMMSSRFAVQSGLKPDWAVRCLEENAWNYEVAAAAFTAFKARGSIPPEAFAAAS